MSPTSIKHAIIRTSASRPGTFQRLAIPIKPARQRDFEMGDRMTVIPVGEFPVLVISFAPLAAFGKTQFDAGQHGGALWIVGIAFVAREIPRPAIQFDGLFGVASASASGTIEIAELVAAFRIIHLSTESKPVESLCVIH